MPLPFEGEELRGTIGDVSGFADPGLEFAKRSVRGDAPAPPIHHLVGLTPTDAGIGKATFAMPVTRWLEDQSGIIFGGWNAVVADAALAVALLTGQPPGRIASTTELFLSYVRPATRLSGSLVARAQAIHVGRELGISHGTIEDGQGRLLAYATTRCVFQDVPVDPDTPRSGPTETIADPPDPYLREVPADSYVDLADIEKASGSELIGASVDGSMHRGPLAHITGFEPLSSGRGRFVGRMAASPWFSSGGPTMYGGMIAWACDQAMNAAIFTEAEAGTTTATLDMDVRFLRPVPVDGSWLRFTAEVRHSGRRLRVADVEVTDDRGKQVAMATGSAIAVPGGVRALMRGQLPDEIISG